MPLKIIRDLNKAIKEEYIVDNAYEFSMALVNAGYTENFFSFVVPFANCYIDHHNI